MQARFNPFPVLETERLLLRSIRSEDAATLFCMRRDPRMHLYTDTKVDETIEETEAYTGKMNQGVRENKWIIWAIEAKESGHVMGTICIWNLDAEGNSAELGYGLSPEFQGQGYMQEALQVVTEYALRVMQLAVLEAYTEAENTSSTKVLAKCGFDKKGEKDDQGYVNQRVYHMHIYQRS